MPLCNCLPLEIEDLALFSQEIDLTFIPHFWAERQPNNCKVCRKR